MITRLTLITSIFLASLQMTVSASANDLDTIIERYRQSILKGGSPANETVTQYVREQLPNGRWPDIDYNDQDKASWRTADHLSRIKLLAISYVDSNSKNSGSSELLAAIEKALDHWEDKRYHNPNWWYNEIGVPRVARDIAVLLYGRLDEHRAQAIADVIGQTRVRGTGANLMWTAELSLHLGCLTGDRALVAQNAAIIADEIKAGSYEGIQYDNSFHQHGPRLQAFHYGKSYLGVAVNLGWQLRGTSWALSAGKCRIISDYFIDGLQWMCRNRYTVPSTLDRAASRQGSLASADLRGLLTLWRDVAGERVAGIENFLAVQNGGGIPVSGFRHFPESDFSTYHRPGFSFFLKTLSDRTRTAESINRENQKGRDMNAGDHYLLFEGDEYHNLQPVWQWDKLPGLTTGDNLSKAKQLPFTGGLGNGDSGLTVMTITRTGENDPDSGFSVRKMWVFREDSILCLIGGWEIEGAPGQLRTSLEQCRNSMDLKISYDLSALTDVPRESVYDNCRYLIHDGNGYMTLEPVSIRLYPAEVEGSWRDINLQYAEETVSDKVFLATIEHGTAPKPGGYAIFPGVTDKQMAELYTDRPWTVVRNDRDCQCVRFDNGTVMAAFYEPGELRFDDGKISVDTPCLAMLDKGQLLLADPTNAGVTVNVTWKGSHRTVNLPSGGVALEVK